MNLKDCVLENGISRIRNVAYDARAIILKNGSYLTVDNNGVILEYRMRVFKTRTACKMFMDHNRCYYVVDNKIVIGIGGLYRGE